MARRPRRLTPEQAAALAAQVKPPGPSVKPVKKPKLYRLGLTQDIVDAVAKSVQPRPPSLRTGARRLTSADAMNLANQAAARDVRPKISTRIRSIGNPPAARHLEPIQVPVTAPWDGYTPDQNHRLTPFGGVANMSGLVTVGEILTTDDGWYALVDGVTTLVFGGDSAVSDYTSSGPITWRAGTRAAGGTAVAQPLYVIGSFMSDAELQATAIVVAATSIVGAPRMQCNLFTNIGGTWATRVFESLDGVNPQPGVTMLFPPPFNGGVLWQPLGPDWASWPSPIPTVDWSGGRIQGTVSLSAPVGAWRRSFFWCNKADEVIRYPSRYAGTGNFTNFFVYGRHLYNAVTADGGVYADLQGLRCASLESYEGRMLYFNCWESLGTAPAPIGIPLETDRPRRIRWSVIGNPMIVSPGFEYTSPGGTQLNGVGAGWIDLDDYLGQGVRIESLGDVVACYLEDGVGFLRRTGDPENAFVHEDVTHERGLLATQALTNLGGGVHFGLFTDGWYFLDSAGRWREAGVHDESGKLSYKWKDDFYNRLTGQVTGLTYVPAIRTSYDPFRKFVRIAIPTSTNLTTASPNTEVWIYDLQGDRVFKDSYAGISGSDRTPSAMGEITRVTSLPVPSTALPTFPVHGDNNGQLYLRDPKTLRRIGVKPGWTFETHDFAAVDPFTIKRLDHVWVQYSDDDTEVDPTPSLTVSSEISSTSQNVDFSQGGGITVHSAKASFNIPGRSHRLALTGVGKPKILGIRVQIVGSEGRLGVDTPAES